MVENYVNSISGDAVKGTERRKEILEWLEREKSLSLAEIVDRFGVSKMTAHRDLEALECRNALKRIHGGVVALEKPARRGTAVEAESVNLGNCVICYRPSSQKLLYSLTLVNGEQRITCCPHCGVSAHIAFGDQVAMALTADFLSGRPHPAQATTFVLGSIASPCCLPSMLTFEDPEMAKRFQGGFGGLLGGLDDAIRYLKEEMSLHRDGGGCPHCAAMERRK